MCLSAVRTVNATEERPPKHSARKSMTAQSKIQSADVAGPGTCQHAHLRRKTDPEKPRFLQLAVLHVSAYQKSIIVSPSFWQTLMGSSAASRPQPFPKPSQTPPQTLPQALPPSLPQPLSNSKSQKTLCSGTTLKTLASSNKEVRPFFLGGNSIWRFPSVSSLSDYSIWRS